MPFSVIVPKVVEHKAYDISFKKARPGHYSVWLVRDDDKIHIGQVLKTGRVGREWWALDTRGGCVQGLATRRHAVENMLRSQGYWKD